MAGEGANKGIGPGLFRELEVDLLGFFRRNDRGIGKDMLANFISELGLGDGVLVIEHAEGGRSHGRFLAGFGQHPVVGHSIDVLEGECDLLSWFP